MTPSGVLGLQAKTLFFECRAERPGAGGVADEKWRRGGPCLAYARRACSLEGGRRGSARGQGRDVTRSCLDQDVCRLLQLGFGRFNHGRGLQVDVHADEISVHLWGVSHRRRRGLLCRGRWSYYDGQGRQKAVRDRTSVRAAVHAFCGEPRRVNGKPLHRARFEYTWTHPRHLCGHEAVGSGPFAKPGNYTHRQWPDSHSTFSGFADIAGTSSQNRVPL